MRKPHLSGPSRLHQEAGYHLSGWEPGWEAHTRCSQCIMENSTSSPPMTGTSRKCQVETPSSLCVPTARGRAAKTAEESRCLPAPPLGAYSLCGLSVPRRLECRRSEQEGLTQPSTLVIWLFGFCSCCTGVFNHLLLTDTPALLGHPESFLESLEHRTT